MRVQKAENIQLALSFIRSVSAISVIRRSLADGYSLARRSTDK